MEELVYLYGLTKISGLGPKTISLLKSRFGCYSEIVKASLEELLTMPRITLEIASQIKNLSEKLEEYQKEIKSLSEEGIQILTIESDTYPRFLTFLDDAPLLLFVAGDIQIIMNENTVGFSGTRTPSRRALNFAKEAAYILAKNGIIIVSGLARGIDTASHMGALEAGGRTIAVLGSGLNYIFPPENRDLAEQIVKRKAGVLLTEFHINTPPVPANLMMRDRLISGLSKAVIAIEGQANSGTLDTAKHALKQNRLLFYFAGVKQRAEFPLADKAKELSKIEDIKDVLETVKKFEVKPPPTESLLF